MYGVLGRLIAVKGPASDAGVYGKVIGADIIPEHAIELCQRMDGADIEPVQPGFFEGPPLTLDLRFTCAIPDTCVDQNCPEAPADQGKLFVGVAAAIVDIKFCRNAVGEYSILEDFLEVRRVVVVEKFTAYHHTRVVIDDKDGVDPAELSVLRYMGQVTGVRLPHASESVFLKSLPVAHVWITRGLQIIAADETLDGAHTDSCRDVAVPDQLEIDLRGVEPRKILPELEDPGDSHVRKDTGGTFVRTCFGHEGVNTAPVVE